MHVGLPPGQPAPCDDRLAPLGIEALRPREQAVRLIEQTAGPDGLHRIRILNQGFRLTHELPGWNAAGRRLLLPQSNFTTESQAQEAGDGVGELALEREQVAPRALDLGGLDLLSRGRVD